MKQSVKKTATTNQTSPITSQEETIKTIRNKNENIYNPGNLLFDLHISLIKSVDIFRRQVCKECDYSYATYYRRMRLSFQNKVNGKSIASISNADVKQMLNEFEDVVAQLTSIHKEATENHKKRK